MRTLALVTSCLPLLGALACGSTGGTTTLHADTSTVTEYEGYANDLATSLAAYRDTMGSAASTPASCRIAHEQYDAEARPTVTRMVDMGTAMDAFMDTHMGEMVTDMSCVANAMMAELDRHAAATCASGDMTTNRAEVDRHVAAMTGYDDHVKDRCQTMMHAGHGSMMWSAPMNGCL